MKGLGEWIKLGWFVNKSLVGKIWEKKGEVRMEEVKGGFCKKFICKNIECRWKVI